MNPMPRDLNRVTLRWLRMLRRSAISAVILQFGALLPGQAINTGTVTGRVYDERTGKSLEGAVVRVAGTNVVDYTTADGRYSVSAPAGSATIEVEYVGLDPFSQSVIVPTGGSTRLNAPLKSNIYQLDSFVVHESVSGQALAINQQKTASGIVNIVSEETFGQMVDNNIGQAMQRLPGISVNEDRDGSATGFNIRGIEGQYNSFQIDGNRAPNSGTTSRAFNARQFDASGVTNIEVIKAPTPDRDGDAIGGIVNVISRSAFQREGRAMELRLAGVYSDLPDSWGHTARFTYSDIYDIAGGEKNLGLSFTLSKSRTDRYSINSDNDWVQITPANNPQLDLGQFGDAPIWFMEASHWDYDTRLTNTYGINGSIDFRTDEFNSFYVRPTFSHFDREGTTFETDVNVDTRFQDTPNGRKTYAEVNPNYGRGTAQSQGRIGYIGTTDVQSSDLYSVALGGRHEKDDRLLTYDLYYSYNKVDIERDDELNMERQPNAPPYIIEYNLIDMVRGDMTFNILQGPPFNELRDFEGELVRISGVKEEDVYSGRLDWEQKFTRDRSTFTVKTGAKYRASKPVFDRTRTDYEMDDSFPWERVVTPTNEVLMSRPKYFDVHPQRGVELLASNPQLFEIDVPGSLNQSNVSDYDAKEETTAAYGMGSWRFGAHTLIAGVRWEKNEWSSVRKDVDLATRAVTPVHKGASYDFFLPGVHLRHELTKNLILRESFNQSYGRPNLAQLTRGRVVAANGSITDGNPNLQPAFSDNYEVQLEYYTANQGLYSVGVFYKDVKDFTYQQVLRFDSLDANGEPIFEPSGEFTYNVPLNGSAAKNKGVELIARQRLYFLPEVLKGFSTAISATFTETEATYPNRTDNRDLPLPGFSEYLFTSSLEYARGNFFGRVDYRFRDDYVEGLGSNIESDEFYAAEEKVDAEIAYRIRRGMSVFLQGTNLTNRPQLSYQGYTRFVEDASISGRKYTIGIEIDF